MNPLEIKKQIIDNKFNPIYYFAGDEWKIMNLYIHKIADTSNSRLVFTDSITGIINNIKNKSLIDGRTVYAINDDKEFMLNEKLWNKIAQLNSNDILIFTFTSIDKRSKFYKHFKSDITMFDKLNDSTLINYINNAIALKNEYALKLIEICEHDYGHIMSEINKLKNYREDVNIGFERLIKNGTIHIPAKDALFDFIDAILKRDQRLSYALYEECKRSEEANLVILLNLFNNTRMTYQVQSFMGNGDICQITGLKQGQIYACQNRLYRYTNEELIDIMRLIQRTESSIKQGTLAEDIAIEYLLANIFRR